MNESAVLLVTAQVSKWRDKAQFDNLGVHVINGVNEKFVSHGSNETLFKQHKITKQNQEAIVIGFYSDKSQGVNTYPGESWHLHVVMKDENIGAHVDGIDVKKNSILKLPESFNKTYKSF